MNQCMKRHFNTNGNEMQRNLMMTKESKSIDHFAKYVPTVNRPQKNLKPISPPFRYKL